MPRSSASSRSTGILRPAVLRQNLGRQQVVDLSALIRRESRLDDHSVLRQNLGRRQVVDLSALIRSESRLDDHSPAPRASTPPLPLRGPPPACSREPRLAPAARRLQAKVDPASTTQN